MIKRFTVLALVLWLVLAVASPALAQDGAGPAITKSAVQTDFPAKLTFSVSARSNAAINDIRLHYTVERDSFAQVTSEVYINFTPGTTVDASWDWDMRQTGGLPPGAGITYWWTVRDANGSSITTSLSKTTFDDNRHSWQTLNQGNITLYWYQGNQNFAIELMQAAQQGLQRLSQSTGAVLQRPIKIYIYNGPDDLRGALIFPSEWVGGVNYFEFGIIAIGIAPSELGWGKGSIVHELTHQTVHQATYNPYSGLPVWLNEGLAMYNQGLLDPFFTSYLQKAVETNTLFSVRSLSSPFSANAEESYLSYAESFSIVAYLISTYGQSQMLELLNTFKEGSTYDDAFTRVYGFDMDGLNMLWRDYVSKQFGKVPARTASALSTRGEILAIGRELQLVYC